ncbi:M protein repeat protein [Paecilomyces variotii No. 5]|uniref:M protein repeat protein n=1 Tax=Byssochlamys spectabilis (strain No. 5 / NBRC 109023) TaxID=1356009 RepID=V5FL60_BYSSN|nr:M protein repeat protein [Paecilomyces variotii No. 5]
MAQNSQQTKPKWGVGSFLQQAVAGVESRLDQILAEEDMQKQGAAKNKAMGDVTGQAGYSAQKTAASPVSRSSSTARKNDRLQERLARAMAKSNTAGNLTSPPSSEAPSRTSSPLPGNDPRSSIDSSAGNAEETTRSPTKERSPSISSSLPRSSHDSVRLSQDFKESQPELGEESVSQIAPHEKETQHDEVDSKPEDPQVVQDRAQAPMPDVTGGATPAPLNEYEATVAQLKAEHKTSESKWQEEMYGYIERIDALQSKLKYLAKEAAESAKKAAATAEPGSVQKQLLEKDEKIALLLEEGQKLSKSEMDHRTAIKKLRQQLSENSKIQVEAKKKTDKLERDLASVEARAKRAEAAEKKANESLSTQTKIAREVEAVSAERDSLKATVQDLKDQLAQTKARAEAAEERAQTEALEEERRRVTALQDDLSSARIERELSEEKLRREIKDLKDGIEREKEKARVLEVELKGEQTAMESQMETLRARAEEVSSSAAGDSQAKLLRQIETLQTQYSVASENWQTLEGSLLSRLANVEKERDEFARREGDLRRKVRELNIKAKKVEEELENSKEHIQDLERSLEETKQELQKLTGKLKKASDDVDAAKKELAEQQKLSEATLSQKLEEERSKWREQAISPTAFLQQPRTESPVASSRRSTTGLDPMSDLRPLSRRSSTLPPQSPEFGTPPRQDSYPSISSPPTTNGASNLTMMGTPSITFEPDEFYGGSGTPATPSAFGAGQTHHSRGINDIISVSTVGAGPSVQLVERMSATVRRLESERAASKDELARITAQRDTARQEVVELMREVEDKRKSDARVQELEAHIADLDQRYETTLELLGEKSEQVEELQADIADLKKIYRELVDSTMK